MSTESPKESLLHAEAPNQSFLLAESPKEAIKAAEEFIDKVAAPARRAPTSDEETARARAELAREDMELARRELAEAGLDVERIERFAAERSKKRRKLAEEGRRKATEASAFVANHLADIAPVIVPIDPLDTVLDQVTFIRSFAGQGTLLDWNIGPGDNWAKYKLDSSVDNVGLDGRLSFFTLWQNRRNSPTVVMARPQFVVNAHLSCDASGGGFLGGTPDLAEATVRARTTIWSMDSSAGSVVYDQELAYAYAKSWWIFGDSDSESIAFNQLLSVGGVVIPAQAYSLIEVELATDWRGIGTTVLDAESGSHRVDVPQIVLTELQTPEPAPPISLTAGVDYETSPPTVVLIFAGLNGSLVDIYQDGVKLGDTPNDGTWTRQFPPGTYSFRVCERMSSVCSTDVTVTVT